MRRSVILGVCLFTPSLAFGEVADASAGGFTVKITTQIHAPPADVYNRVVHNIGDWWSPDHTFSGNSHNLSIDDRPLGCFCEKLPAGGVRHMEVIYAAPGQMLRLSGGLGPLQSMAVTGSMTLAFSAANGGTKLDATYAVSGYSPAGLDSLAKAVDGVLGEQIARLKSYIETGSPQPSGANGASKK